MKKVFSVLFVLVLFCFVAPSAMAQGTGTGAPAGTASAATAPAAPTVLNVKRVGTLAPITINPPAVTVEGARVVVPDRITVAVTEVPESPSWCSRNPGWCGLTVAVVSAAVIGGGAMALDGLGAFDREVSFNK